MPNETRHYYPAASRVFFGAVGFFIALFGVAFAITGLERIGRNLAEGGGQALFGAAVLCAAWRMARYPARPAVSLTDEALIQRRMFWLPTTLRFDDITGLGLYNQANQARVYTGTHQGRVPGVTVTSQHLVAALKSGRTHTLTLPGFNNADLLAELTARTGMAIERLPDRKAG